MTYLNIIVNAPGQMPNLRAYPVGELNAKQKAERSQGTRLDPEGHPVRIMNP